MELIRKLKNYDEQPMTSGMMRLLLKDYKRPYDKISEMIEKGVLTTVKKGLYVAGPESGLRQPELFLLANHIMGPSYISMESALSWWKYIPERVYEITSSTIRPTKTFRTSLGRFIYIKFPLPWYAFGLKQVKLTTRQMVIMASPEKALCDKIIFTSGILLRSIKQTLQFLTEDLRIEPERLKELNTKEIRGWLNDAPKKSSIEILIKSLETL